MTQYTVGQTLYNAAFGCSGELEITRSIVEKVTPRTVMLSCLRNGEHVVLSSDVYYKISLDTGLISEGSWYPTPDAALQALFDDLQVEVAPLQDALRTNQVRKELVYALRRELMAERLEEEEIK